MKNTELLYANSEGVTSASLVRHITDWLVECEFAGVSKTTLEKYRTLSGNLTWFLNVRELPSCGKRELQQFFLYLRNGHDEPGGRWGNPRNSRPVTSGTVTTYFTVLRTLFRYMTREGMIDVSPLESMPRPVDRPDQIQPFTTPQIEALIAAAKRSRHPRRDEAIIKFLFDTGVRASELCSLKIKDIDFETRCCRVLGKGNKHRSIFFGRECSRTLWQYLKDTSRERDDNGHLFLADRGGNTGNGLTRSGLLQLIGRLGEVANIESARCSPHTFRHSFAINFIRNGGNVFSLQQILGHTSLGMTNRYVALAQADIENQHRQFSPVDGLRRSHK